MHLNAQKVEAQVQVTAVAVSLCAARCIALQWKRMEFSHQHKFQGLTIVSMVAKALQWRSSIPQTGDDKEPHLRQLQLRIQFQVQRQGSSSRRERT